MARNTGGKVGITRVRVILIGSIGRIEIKNAIVDTGAYRSSIPLIVAKTIGVEPVGKENVGVGTGGHAKFPTGKLEIDFPDYHTSAFSRVWINKGLNEVLIGALTLEDAELSISPKTKKLGKTNRREVFLYQIDVDGGTQRRSGLGIAACGRNLGEGGRARHQCLAWTPRWTVKS